ncbi:hypothetical protein Tco_0280790 [Tanacetum coccineum]
MRVLEGLKSYNNDIKYSYVQRELTSDEVEYLKLFEEEIKVRLKYRNQMRRWEIARNRQVVANSTTEAENVACFKLHNEIGVNAGCVSPSSSTIAFISSTSIDGTSSVSTRTSLVRWLNVTEASLLITYQIIVSLQASQLPFIWLATNLESTLTDRDCTPIFLAACNPTRSSSYSAWLVSILPYNLYVGQLYIESAVAPWPHCPPNLLDWLVRDDSDRMSFEVSS